MKYKPTCSRCGPLEGWVNIIQANEQAAEHLRALPSHSVSIITRGTSPKDAKTRAAGE